MIHLQKRNNFNPNMVSSCILAHVCFITFNFVSNTIYLDDT